MLYVLLILIVTALLTAFMPRLRRFAALGHYVAPAGMALALATALFAEGAAWERAVPIFQQWPTFMSRAGAPFYASDALSAGLGAWCLLLGLLWLLFAPSHPLHAVSQVRESVAGTLAVAVLYSLAHTWDLRVFAAQMLLLVLLAWALSGEFDDVEEEVGSSRPRYSLLVLGAGALCLLGAVLIIGRTAGGEYGLSHLSALAFTPWPLALIVLGAALWLGFAPLAGWSSRSYRPQQAALMQSAVVGVPFVALLLRLQGLVSEQSFAGAVFDSWKVFTVALAWIGGLCALAAAAGVIATAGTDRWWSVLTAQQMGLVVCGVGLDTPQGRSAALAILLSFGLARMFLLFFEAADSLPVPRYGWLLVGASIAAAPLTAGFIGLWLLATRVAQAGHASLSVGLAGIAILSACGVGLHFLRSSPGRERNVPARIGILARWRTFIGLVVGVLLLAAGIMPGLWLPGVALMAGAGGGGQPFGLTWLGVQIGATPSINAFLPTLPLALAVLLAAGIGRLLLPRKVPAESDHGVLLLSALAALESTAKSGTKQDGQEALEGTAGFPAPLPLPVWWLSLLWFEQGLVRAGQLVLRLLARVGMGLARVEGRYYLPVALVFTLIALLAITR